ncbi:DoxX family membrane protein [Polaribacter aquimarinus]|uniref:DoxX family protein n=1 Tax=Polaribacter aquimarinus TaxID=2100726 RepID=A0A2U2JA19_9FLAO|nr:DoxX family membrane protein [Polaribacter aquimarinus]PWG05165.1 DoxX family protein [Polaribacter aquimarinus]
MNTKIIFVLKLLAAIIMLQTLFYKFTGAQESVDLFTKLAGDNEKILRIATGILELIASILLFIPKKVWIGALFTLVLMGGAILVHITKIGIQHNNDGGLLFFAAIFTFICGLIILLYQRKSLPLYNKE